MCSGLRRVDDGRSVVGDGWFAMLMAELATAVQQDLPVKVLILNNGRLAEVAFEQCEAGFGVFGCELSPIDFSPRPRPAVPTGSVARNRRKFDRRSCRLSVPPNLRSSRQTSIPTSSLVNPVR
jgi:hypothetical protein